MNYDPRVLEVTTAKVCGVNCTQFCPQMRFREAYGDSARLLSMEDFAVAMEHTPKAVWIVFAGHSEPFINPKTLDMMELAHSQGRIVQLFSTLVNLAPEDVARLKRCVDKFVWHVPDNRGIAHINLTDKYMATLKEVLGTLDIDGYSRMDNNFLSNERAGNCEGVEPFHFKGPFYCRKLTTPQFVMLPDGRVVLCCMDWTLKHVVGDLLTQTFDEIAQGEPYRKIAAQMLRWDGDVLCRSCTMPRTIPQEAAYRAYRWGRSFFGTAQGGPKVGAGHGLANDGTEASRT